MEKIKAEVQINFEGIPAIQLTAYLTDDGEYMRVSEEWINPPCPTHEQWWEDRKQHVFDHMKDRLIKANAGVRN